MCERYSAQLQLDLFIERFGFAESKFTVPSRYNIARTGSVGCWRFDPWTPSNTLTP